VSGPTVSTGVDVIEIARIARSLERFGSRFLNRIYTEGEQRHCRGRPNELAVRFAAKEAASKALGTGMRGLRWRDIEVLVDPRGKPQLRLHGPAAAHAAAAGLASFALSLSHSREFAIAVVVALGP